MIKKSSIVEYIQTIKARFKKKKAQLLYQMNGGYKCVECGKVIPLQGNNIRGLVNGVPLMVERSGDYCLCAHCLYRSIEKYFEMSPIASSCDYLGFKGVTREPCIVYPNERYSIRGIKKDDNLYADILCLDVRIGSSLWDDSFVSEKALRELLLFAGQYHTLNAAVKDGDVYYKDKNDILVSYLSKDLKVFNGN